MVSPELLRRYAFFGGLSEEQLKALAMIGEEETYETDEYIFEEGEECEALYVVVEGVVAILVTTDDEEGIEEELTQVPAGSVLAWAALTPPYEQTASAAANTPVKLIAIDAEALRDLLDKDCAMGYKIAVQLLKVISERMAQTQIQLASLSAC